MVAQLPPLPQTEPVFCLRWQAAKRRGIWHKIGSERVVGIGIDHPPWQLSWIFCKSDYDLLDLVSKSFSP